jgi:hypothetical protein
MIDGILGLVAMMLIVFSFLIIFSGVIFPIMLMSDDGGTLSKLYPYLLDSRLINWLAEVYQVHIIPLLN